MCRKNERTHKHHIIPRYMGGTDTTENLVEITVTQHAMYHFCNYQLWGNEEDKIAWRMLGKQITLDEAKLEAVKLGGKRGRETQKILYKDENYKKEWINKCREAHYNSPNKDKIINILLNNQSKAVEASKTPEAIKRKKKKLKEIKHQQGGKNSQYGKMWITNGTKEGTYRINKGELIPEGYWKGRVCFEEEKLNFIYTIITPDGKKIQTKNLNIYSKQNHLSYNSMRDVSIGNQKTHKRYKITRELINNQKTNEI